ncbi:MAG: DMT family transporter [Hyphomicrobiaceae bacterium]
MAVTHNYWRLVGVLRRKQNANPSAELRQPVDHRDILPGNVRAVLWALLAAGALAAMLAFIKLLGRGVPVVQIMLIRQSVIFLVALPVIATEFPDSLKSAQPHLQLLRVALSLVAILAGYTAIIHLPMADYAALTFSKPFFITIFAIWFLSEHVDGRRWLATGVGFVGVLIMLRPGLDGVDFYALLAIFGAACIAGVSIILRQLSRTDSPITILTYQAVLVGFLVAPFAVENWVALTPVQWGQALAVGLLGAVAQLASIRSFRAGPAAVVAPIDYTKLIWASVIGIIVFDQLPQLSSVVGGAIIVAASFYVLARELGIVTDHAGR